MKPMLIAAVIAPLVLPAVAHASTPCSFTGNVLTAGENGTSLVARLVNPPRTRVVLSIDGPGGLNQELVWDPTIGDGLQHDALLPGGTYSIHAFADDDRAQTSRLLMITSTRFFTLDEATRAAAKLLGAPHRADSRPTAVMASRVRTLVVAEGQTQPVYVQVPVEPDPWGTPQGTGVGGEYLYSVNHPQLILTCDDGRVELARLRLNTKQLQAGAVARGFLDQSAPAIVTDTLSLIAEIVVERAKAGAMELVRERFVDPLCAKLNLYTLRLGSPEEPAFPRVCALLRSTRIEDVLSSGRSLINAARDDVRLTLMPRMIAKADMPPVAREVTLLALRLGNEMLEGGGTDSAALDLVVTQLERILRVGGITSVDGVKQRFIDVVLDSSTAAQREALITDVLQQFLPKDPGALLSEFAASEEDEQLAASLLIANATACRRLKDTRRFYIPADKKSCITQLATILAAQADWRARIAKVVENNELIGLLDTIRSRDNLPTFDEWLETATRAVGDVLARAATDPPAPLLRSCAVRVAIGVLKWCSNRDTCTAADIATAMAKPENLFAPPEKQRALGLIDGLRDALVVDVFAPAGGDREDQVERLCWKERGSQLSLQLPAVHGPYIELASRAVAFLTPPAKGEERQRVLAMLRWMFDLAKVVDSPALGGASAVQQIEEIVEHFAQRDYVRAISQTLLVAARARCKPGEDCELPEELQKAVILIGAVGSYMQVYEETKGTDPGEAKAARKKAIETLIDASTDRKGRAGELIYSLGVPVGITGALRWAPRDPDRGTTGPELEDRYKLENVFSWRLPIGIAAQRMSIRRESIGWHLALTFADLGNFVRGDANGEDDDIQWKDFVQLGAQAGLLFGNGRHTVLVALDLSWSPGLYERDLMVTTDDGTTETQRTAGALLAGITLAYYVPLFDFN